MEFVLAWIVAVLLGAVLVVIGYFIGHVVGHRKGWEDATDATKAWMRGLEERPDAVGKAIGSAWLEGMEKSKAGAS